MGYGSSNAIIIVTAVFLWISLVSVCLRCFVRLRIVNAFGGDDALIVAAMILNVGFAVCTTLGASSGMGKTVEYLADRPEEFRRGMLFWWLGQLLYIITVTVGRIAIAITLLRLTVERIHTWILYAVMAFSTVVGAVFFFFTIFQCQPVSYYWNRLFTEGHCLNVGSLLGIVYMYSGVAAVCDFTMGILPVFLIWNLQMDRRTKVAVSGILGIACIASTAVIIRIPFLKHAKSPDFLHTTTQISIWSNIEASLGITAGSLATVRPIIRMCSRVTSAIPSQHSLLPSQLVLSKRRAPAESRSGGEDAYSQSTEASHPRQYQTYPPSMEVVP
ncbi:hypothetical protein ETB97_003381 [Aspergillus alliaceus]|uniref:Rhodopsin domain-containing protein n=1 Tax=Petromyces alliaceus TaxID=209559 RepID=A0A5N7CQA7_PETAA|nr:uncharacterized protein BDW43DRAFT_15584 [Aspergillus alliaceus]KAB8235896.1 hypothetical protein BDW43DRAFT_15584 [Aspergillus alliaceus]KAE8396396.1 hypothetical protein BDV23DRAFT_177932 [Aspergillus alliaceus]KAF5865537.1 hypothetical protein ETB97_003381 [Aspergillus burnettii]